MKLPQTILIKETNFANAWARAVRYALRDGVQMVIGDASEPKPIHDICATIELTGDAITQIENRELHPQFPFRHVDFYCDEFTREYLAQYIKKPDGERFTYLYLDRLVRYGSVVHGHIDQLAAMRTSLWEQVRSGVSSNRNQAITWRPMHDVGTPAAPCLQRIWIRYLGDNCVEVDMDWRSRDLFTAWQANLIALVDMLNREVIRPGNCRIVKLVDYVDSLHIYESDVAAAKEVRLVPVSPQNQRGG